MIAVALIAIFKLPPRYVVGTDVFHAALLLWAAGLAHWAGGTVDFSLMGTLLIGSIPGVWFGSQLSVKVPEATLRTALGTVLVLSASATLAKADIEFIPAVLICGTLAFYVTISIF